MSKITKIVLLFVVLNGLMLTTWADKGVGKNKKKITLTLNTNNNLTNNTFSFNLKTGLKYTGSLINGVEGNKNSVLVSTLVTYQKGNAIFIVPYKQKTIIPEMKPGYTGMKLIIKPKL